MFHAVRDKHSGFLPTNQVTTEHKDDVSPHSSGMQGAQTIVARQAPSTRLDQLPTELTQEVLEYCDIADWKNLRLANRFFATLLALRVLRVIKFPTHTRRGKSSSYSLVDFLNQPIASVVKCCKVTLSPIKHYDDSLADDRTTRAPMITKAKTMLANMQEAYLDSWLCPVGHGMDRANGEIIRQLNELMTKMVGLERLRFELNHHEGSFGIVMAGVQLHALRELHLESHEATSTQITKLLQPVVHTIKSVTLAYLDLSSGCWDQVFVFLGTDCQLDHFKFCICHEASSHSQRHEYFSQIQKAFDNTVKTTEIYGGPKRPREKTTLRRASCIEWTKASTS